MSTPTNPVPVPQVPLTPKERAQIVAQILAGMPPGPARDWLEALLMNPDG
jgi:hypothetical protein